MSVPTQQVSVSYFKAHCLEMLNNVHAGKYELLLTKRNKPYAKVTPESDLQTREERLKANNYYCGILEGTVHIHGDLLEPMDDDWEANKD